MSKFAYYTITPQPEKNPVAYIFRLFSDTCGTFDCLETKAFPIRNTHLRTTLFIPAMHAYRSRTFAKYVSRLQKNGKRPKVIIVALMRKLAVIAYYLIKTGQDFDNSRYE